MVQAVLVDIAVSSDPSEPNERWHISSVAACLAAELTQIVGAQHSYSEQLALRAKMMQISASTSSKDSDRTASASGTSHLLAPPARLRGDAWFCGFACEDEKT